MKREDGRKTYSLWLDESETEAAKAKAKDADLSLSWVVRRLLHEWLENGELPSSQGE